jgi:hypothetical protein
MHLLSCSDEIIVSVLFLMPYEASRRESNACFKGLEDARYGSGPRRQENCEFEGSLGCIVRPCLKKIKKRKERRGLEKRGEEKRGEEEKTARENRPYLMKNTALQY